MFALLVPERTGTVTISPERPVTFSTSEFNRTSIPSSFISSRRRGGNVGVFFLKQPRTMLDDRDAAAEASHRLGELQADVTSSENDEVLRQALQVQGLDVRHWPGVGEPGNVGDTAPGCRH